MGLVQANLPSDGEVNAAASVNNPINAIITEVNGNLDSNNLANNAVTNSKLANNSVSTANLQEGSVTQGKLAHSPKTGTFTFPDSTGNFSVTGVGYPPSLVEFEALVSDDQNVWYRSSGAMDKDGNQWAVRAAGSSGSVVRTSSTSLCWIMGVHTTLDNNREAEFVSMDSDGFTINVLTTAGTFSVAYKVHP